MKQILKKLSFVLLVLTLFGLEFSFTVSAADTIDYPKTQIFYMAGRNKAPAYTDIFISGLSDKQNILKSSVKILSGKSTIDISDFARMNNNRYTVWFGRDGEPNTYTDNYYSIGIKVKKAGTGKVSFKVGKKSYISTIKILPYTNPIAGLTINGTSSNLAGKFKANNTGGSIRIKKAQKNAFISCKAAGGWKITSISFFNKRTNVTYSTAKTNGIKRSDGVSSLGFYVGNLTAKQTGTISIELINDRTGGSQTCTIDLK